MNIPEYFSCLLNFCWRVHIDELFVLFTLHKLSSSRWWSNVQESCLDRSFLASKKLIQYGKYALTFENRSQLVRKSFYNMPLMCKRWEKTIFFNICTTNYYWAKNIRIFDIEGLIIMKLMVKSKKRRIFFIELYLQTHGNSIWDTQILL